MADDKLQKNTGAGKGADTLSSAHTQQWLWCKWNNLKDWHLLLHFGLQYVWLPFKSLVIILSMTPSVDPF